MIKTAVKQVVDNYIDKELGKLDELNQILNEVGIPNINFSIRQIGDAAGKLVSKKLVESGIEIADKLRKNIEERLTSELINEALAEIDFDKLVKKTIQDIVNGKITTIIKDSLLTKDNYGHYGNMKNINDLKSKILDKTTKGMLSRVDSMFTKEPNDGKG